MGLRGPKPSEPWQPVDREACTSQAPSRWARIAPAGRENGPGPRSRVQISLCFGIFCFFTTVFCPARGFKGFPDPVGIDSDQIWAQTDPPRPNSLPKLHFSAFWGFLHMHMHMHMPYAYATYALGGSGKLWQALGSSGGALGGSGGYAINFHCENLMFFAKVPLKLQFMVCF